MEKDTGPRPPGYDHGGCYDEKRERIYMGPGVGAPATAEGIYIYDIATRTWTKPASKGTPPHAFQTNHASACYDVTNDVVTIFNYGEGKIFTYVPETETRSDQPFPTLESVSRGQQSAFYDPRLNVYFLYIAADANEGTLWAYRYKSADLQKKSEQKK